MSWWNPGSVSGSVRTAPPGRSAASSTITGLPASASRIAATSPFGPAPITTDRFTVCLSSGTSGVNFGQDYARAIALQRWV